MEWRRIFLEACLEHPGIVDCLCHWNKFFRTNRKIPAWSLGSLQTRQHIPQTRIDCWIGQHRWCGNRQNVLFVLEAAWTGETLYSNSLHYYSVFCYLFYAPGIFRYDNLEKKNRTTEQNDNSKDVKKVFISKITPASTISLPQTKSGFVSLWILLFSRFVIDLNRAGCVLPPLIIG